jgi:hypothetical protein
MGLGKLVKDLLYDKNNEYLDISRASVGLSVVCFWAACGFQVALNPDKFDPLAVGGGIAALFAGGAGWIYARQKYEKENP